MKDYGAQRDREFTREEVQRKARLIVAMLTEIVYGMGPNVKVSRDQLNNLIPELSAVIMRCRVIAEMPPLVWAEAINHPF